MLFLFFILLVTGFSFVFAIRKQRPIFLVVPFLTLLLYITAEIAAVPAPFMETVKFIFSLR